MRMRIRDGRLRFRVETAEEVHTHCVLCGVVAACYHALHLRGAGRKSWYRAGYICAMCMGLRLPGRLKLQAIRED